MTPGQIARALLGTRGFRFVGRVYRAIFVDLRVVAGKLAAEIPPNAHVLDIGGGDGDPINHLLLLRPDLSVTMIDIAPEVGTWLHPRFGPRVTCHPETDIAEYIRALRANIQRCALPPDVVMVTYVLHHIPPAARLSFFTALADLFQFNRNLHLIFTDVEPGHWRSRLGYLSDRYVTGDRHVSLIGRSELTRYLDATMGAVLWHDTALTLLDAPNYMIVCRKPT